MTNHIMSIVWSIDGGNEDEEKRRKKERKVLQKLAHHISGKRVLSQLWNYSIRFLLLYKAALLVSDIFYTNIYSNFNLKTICFLKLETYFLKSFFFIINTQHNTVQCCIHAQEGSRP